jgi:hypothetical protein
MTAPINRGMHRDHTFDFGLGEGNRLGYVHVVLWSNFAPKDAAGREAYTVARTALWARIADLVEADPECERILQGVSDLRVKS